MAFISICLVPLSRVVTEHGARLIASKPQQSSCLTCLSYAHVWDQAWLLIMWILGSKLSLLAFMVVALPSECLSVPGISAPVVQSFLLFLIWRR